MIRRFCSGSVDAGQAGEEPLPGVDHDQVHAEVGLERDAQELRLLLAHQPVVDVDAGQPVADRAVDERRRHRRVHAARERADDLAVRAGLAGVPVDALADLGDRGLDEVGRRPGGRDARDADDEVAQHVLAARRVDDLGVELDAVQVAGRAPPDPANGVESVWAVAWKPSGRRVIESPWLIQTGCSRSSPANRPSSLRDLDGGRAVLALATAGITSPPSSRAISWAP